MEDLIITYQYQYNLMVRVTMLVQPRNAINTLEPNVYICIGIYHFFYYDRLLLSCSQLKHKHPGQLCRVSCKNASQSGQNTL